MTNTDKWTLRAELLEHAERLHAAYWALATTDAGDLGVQHGTGRQPRPDWGPYDFTVRAFVEVLCRIIRLDGMGDPMERAWNVRDLMLDQSGEGVDYWVRAEHREYAAAHEMIMILEDTSGEVYLSRGGETWAINIDNADATEDADGWWAGTWAPSTTAKVDSTDGLTHIATWTHANQLTIKYDENQNPVASPRGRMYLGCRDTDTPR